MARRLTISRRGQRPNNSWFGVISSEYVDVAAATKQLLGSLVPSNAGIDETVLRLIGNVSVMSDQAANLERQIGSIGLIVVSNQAVAAGAASIPGPSTDIEDDGWFAHMQFAQLTNRDTDAVGIASLTYDFSSKGRRVVQEGESIAIMAENIHATNALSLALQFRLLSRVTGT